MAANAWLLVLPIVAQFAAAAIAFRLIAATGRRRAWSLVALAFLLMGFRRLFTLIGSLRLTTEAHVPPVADTLFALAISLLLLLGVVQLLPMFREAQSSVEAARRSAAELALTEARSRTLMERLPEAVLVIRKDRLVFANSAVQGILGVTPEEAVGRSLEEFIAPEYRDRLAGWRPEPTESETGLAHPVFEVVRADGVRRWVELHGHESEWDGGRALVAVLSDITERRLMTVALEESEEKFRSLTETAASAIFVYQGTKFAYVNPAAESLTGYSSDELLHLDFWDTVHPDHRDLVKQRGLARQRGETLPPRYEFKIQRKDGEARWVDFTAGLIRYQGEPAGLGTAFDITARKLAEEALHRRDRILEAVSFAAREFLRNPVRRDTVEGVLARLGEAAGVSRVYIFANHQAPDGTLLTSQRHEWVAPGVAAQIDNPDLQGFAYVPNGFERWIRVLGSGDVIQGPVREFPASERAILEAQDIRSIMVVPIFVGGAWWGFLGFDECGSERVWSSVDLDALKAAVGTFEAALERQRGEAALHGSEERFRTLFNNVTIGLYRTTPDGRILLANPTLVHMLGYGSFEELARHNVEETRFYRDLDRSQFRAQLMRDREIRGLETRMVRADGKPLWVRESVRVVRDEADGSVYFEGSLEDITDRKLLEEQLRQAQKMETVGRLAGGIAHDLNNLLLPIMTATELLQRRLPAEAPAHEELAIIHRTASRAADLTRSLLAFARRQVLQAVDLDLDRVIAGMLPMLRRLIPENVRIDYIPGHELGTVSADPAQLEQVIINLCANARDAMPDGGTLSIETSATLINGAYVATHPWATPGRYVLLRVSDNGSGMDEETLAHIFEPFFTTKETGKGTGLGLATVYGIVKQHGGMIHAYSEPGRGTTFKVYLPVVRRAAIVVGPKIEGPVRGGEERILIVEDDPEVCRILVDVLGGLGYRVSAASDGVQALEALTKHGSEVDLVITDVVMPRMGGVELCRAAESVAPHALFLLSSGYSESVISEELLRRRGAAFIAKPYGIDALARKVREILDAKAKRSAGQT